MDPPHRAGLGLKTQTRPSRMTEASLSTAPASPTERADETIPPKAPHTETSQTITTSSSAPPYSTLGHLSFAPATQQTVVTTTTTTTVSLPPLLFKPPRHLSTRDPKQYPLALAPTPNSLKNFCIQVGDKPVVYKESADAQASLTKFQRQQAHLQESDGTLRHERSHPPVYATASQSKNVRPSLQKRPVSPPSLAEAAEIASLHRRRKKPRSLLSRTRSGLEQPLFAADQTNLSDTAATLSGPTPVTPDTEAAQSMNPESTEHTSREPRRSTSRSQEWQTNAASQRQTRTASQRLGLPPAGHERYFDDQHAATATPPVAESDLDPSDAIFPHDHEYRRPLPPSLLNGSQQDASLPSPSLSPVTAAANLARSHQQLLNAASDAADVNDDGNASEVSGLDLDDNAMRSTGGRSVETMPEVTSNPHVRSHQRAGRPASSITVMDIPTMIEAFDSLPDDMQTYVMYQMLRRSSKKTLQTVAAVVNPALKCDPFDVLPVELGLQITKFLDAKSLCQAAQVSKKWRHLIDSDERAWKELLDGDGFNLPIGEVERAVREGWGWQNPGIDGYEQDLSAPKPPRPLPFAEQDPLSPAAAPSASSDDQASSASQRLTRLKRKSTGGGSSSKRQKRKASAKKADDSPPFWLKDLEHAQGPIAYASAAAKAVPNPGIGLSSLANLHLFKSIYQRHYLISKSWMDQDSVPQHLAFRAHHRHVVTCLLFDFDKILTGSDDTNINVYDTKTGVLRKRLEGHEGGVWALQYEGDTLVSGSTDRSVRVWDIPTGKCLQTFQGHTSTVRCLVILKPAKIGVEADGTPIIMPKEPLIITGSRDSTLRVWKLPQPGDPQVHQAGPPANDSDNPYSLRVLQGHHNSVRAIAAHGDTLVSGSYDCTVRVWKISTGELLHRLSGHSQKVYSVVLDHERGRCISGSMDNLVKVWSIESGVCLFNLEGHTSLVGLLDLSHERLVSAAADSTLRIWHPETGQCLSKLEAHTGAITCFQHDDQKVISGSDRTLKMWNIETGECVRDLLSDLSGVWQVRFDERRCVAAVQRNNLTYIEVISLSSLEVALR
ncbi:WD40-repeat-containing domain protein [Delphinella strobiligena]|nr:WD40-repeat-containing domain protein [Delphinella strobiligena]